MTICYCTARLPRSRYNNILELRYRWSRFSVGECSIRRMPEDRSAMRDWKRNRDPITSGQTSFTFHRYPVVARTPNGYSLTRVVSPLHLGSPRRAFSPESPNRALSRKPRSSQRKRILRIRLEFNPGVYAARENSESISSSHSEARTTVLDGLLLGRVPPIYDTLVFGRRNFIPLSC